VQGGSADVWKENIMEELELGEIKYETAEEFLISLKKEFGGGEKKSVKAAELRNLEQGGRIMEEFMQEFKKVVRGSGYEGRPLIEEFKRGMNGGIRRKLMEAENPPVSIDQWYKRAMALDRNWRESKREEERLRGKREIIGGALKQEQRQIIPRPLVWQRRQMPSQQATIGLALMEGVEGTNTVVVRRTGQEQGMGVPLRWDPYTIEVDQGRNCYTCRGFGHIARHCRNRGRERPIEGRRVEYERGRQHQTNRTFKRGGELRSSQLSSCNKFSVLAMEINADISGSKGIKKEIKVKKVGEKTLREVTVKIGLERIDMQERIIVEALLDSGATRLVMSSKFAKKQDFKLKKLERLMNVRNVDRSLNKEGPIENTVEVNIYYQGHRERTEIDVIGGQKWTVILGMPWLACHNPEIDWRTVEVKMTRCPEECGKQ